MGLSQTKCRFIHWELAIFWLTIRHMGEKSETQMDVMGVSPPYVNQIDELELKNPKPWGIVSII